MSIRLALGARPASLLYLVIAQGMGLTLVGAVLGIIGALIFGRYLVSILYGVQLTDWRTIGGVLAAVISVALISCAVPARRAAGTDPLAGLRGQ